MINTMTSLERVLTALSHKEPDRVPFFLLLTLHGAKELGLTIQGYFSNPENVIEGQIRLREKYRHDCYLPFFYAAIETEAFGGEVIFYDDGPPNSGSPVIKSFESIRNLSVPDIKQTPCLQAGLETIRGLKDRIGDDAPILGFVISPYSLPVMQMGFDSYFDLMHSQKDLFWKLMRVNSEFCTSWANAQLEAGATAICYFDPVSSPTIVPPELSRETGFPIAREIISQIKGPAAIHFGSGNCVKVIDDAISTGAVMTGCSCQEDLFEVKAKCSNKITVLGNLNGVEMRTWTIKQTRQIVKHAIFKAAKGGGFILSDNHGEIPWQVGDDILMEISDTVHTWGKYPIQEMS